jgi:hypothetical protein
MVVVHFADGGVVVPGGPRLVDGVEQIAPALEARSRDIGGQGEFRELHLPGRMSHQKGAERRAEIAAPGK